MEIAPGSRIRARGLTWEVLETLRAGSCEKLSLRCATGDLAGLEWEMFVPPETVEPDAPVFDFRRPAPLPLWRLSQRAHVLGACVGGEPIATAEPGRLRIEPFQRVALARALDLPRPRLLLADGVGLGKTVQAGLIAADLIARRRAHRILIVCPSGPLARQWDQETRLRFGLKFVSAASAAELADLRRDRERGANPFDAVPLCLTTWDFAKQDHVLDDIELSAWDLAILDEAHHAFGPAGGGETTRRRRLAEVLARRSDGLLLLTATPHDGHDAHFASLIALLDPSLTDGAGGLIGREYRRHVVRRLKSHIRDPRTGAPLFRRRTIQPVKVDTKGPEHAPARAFHRALTAFVVPRLRAPRGPGGGDAIAFVSLLKRSVSTVAACAATLRVVAGRLALGETGVADPKAAQTERARALRRWRRHAARFGALDMFEDAARHEAEAETMAAALRRESAAGLDELLVLSAAAAAADPKLGALVQEVRLIRAEWPRANILVYTEYTDSQAAAVDTLRVEAGLAGEILTIGGEDSTEIRSAAAERFATEDGLILVGTDALAEGLNLQRRCFHLIHLDLPYNPNRLEQRNGRIDRYGQTRDPDIRYLYLPGTFEERLLLHLIAKYEKSRAALDVMPDTLGVAAAGDAEPRGSLTRGLSEDPADLFPPDRDAIRPLRGDRDNPGGDDPGGAAVLALIRDIDRAFEGFERMAVAHGWFDGGRVDRTPATPPPFSETADMCLADFVAAVAAAETGAPVAEGETLRLPPRWMEGLEGLPGLDPAGNIARFTRDPETFRDRDGQPVAFLGRAHPLVLRALREAGRTPACVAHARAGRAGLLSTFLLEIHAGQRLLLRRPVAILSGPGAPPVETDLRAWLGEGVLSPLAPGSVPEIPEIWIAGARGAMDGISVRARDAVAQSLALRKPLARARWSRWADAEAARVCGAYVPPVPDLFGAPPPGPAWRHEADAEQRLILFATSPDSPPGKRREANAALAIFRAAWAGQGAPPIATHRPIGLLVLVADAGR